MTLAAFVQGIGLLGPGLASWSASQDVLRGREPHRFELATLPAPPRLPPAERRRAGPVIRLAMAVAEEAVAHADVDPAQLATVFSSSGGEGANCHSLCETLAGPNPLLSPTRFTNSVHNAASGYWHIAVASRENSTSLCAFDGSFGAGLVEAAVWMRSTGAPVLLVAYDLPYPEPLNSVRPLLDSFGLALLLTPTASARSLAALRVDLVPAASAQPDRCADASLEALRTNLPAAAALPLLQALAGADRPAGEPSTLAYLPAWHLRVCVGVPLDAARPGRPDVTLSVMNRDGIARLIPHAGAMCLLAHLDAWDGDRIACRASGHRDVDHPLRTQSGLLACCAIEYAAQAVALHGALVGGAAGRPPTPGYLASARGVTLHRLRLDDLPGELRVEAERQAGDGGQILYRFSVTHAGGPVAEGRLAVVLNTPLP